MPEPSSSGIVSASHARRSAWRSSRMVLSARPSRRNGPRNVVSSAPSWAATSLDDSIVGGRGAAEDRNLRSGEPIDEATDAPVVGTEVVAPVGDAVHLVDDDQPGPRADQRHDHVGELGIGEPLGRDEQEIDGVLIAAGCATRRSWSRPTS